MFDNLASSVTSPQFQPWEVNDQRPKLNFDIAAAENQPNTGLLKLLLMCTGEWSLCCTMLPSVFSCTGGASSHSI